MRTIAPVVGAAISCRDTEFSGIAQDLMAHQPDILCWDTAYEPFGQGRYGGISALTFFTAAPVSDFSLETLFEVFVDDLILILQQPIDRRLEGHRFVNGQRRRLAMNVEEDLVV